MRAAPSEFPVCLQLASPLEVARWRPLVNWILAVPQALVGGALGGLREALTLIALFTILFTKTIPRPIFDVIVWTCRYQWRVSSYALLLREQYPPYDFTMSADDTGGDPATLSISYPVEFDRWAPPYLAASTAIKEGWRPDTPIPVKRQSGAAWARA
jgi:hypothetical protein